MKHLVTLLTLACSFAIVGCGGSATPGETVESFVLALEAGDAQTVKELSPGMSSIMGSEKVDAWVTETAVGMAQKGGVESVTIDDETIDGNIATVTTTITMGNGEKDTDAFELAKIKDQWIIDVDDGKDSDDEDEEKDTSAETAVE